MNKSELQAKFPTWEGITSDPDPACKVCNGGGVRRTKATFLPEVPCLCACISGDGRGEVAGMFQQSVRNVAKKLGVDAPLELSQQEIVDAADTKEEA